MDFSRAAIFAFFENYYPPILFPCFLLYLHFPYFRIVVYIFLALSK